MFEFLGFGKGKIDIDISKFDFTPGETIEGKVTLTMKKPVKARAFYIQLVGIRKSSSLGRNSSSSSSTVYDFKQTLDKEKEYSGEQIYSFKLKIPSSIVTQPSMGSGGIGTLIKSAQLLSGANIRINWYLKAFLDVPSGLDVSKKIQVNIE